MRCVIQRVSEAAVQSEGRTLGRIERGLVVLAAFATGDTANELGWCARKIPALRLFNDQEGRINLSLREVSGSILLISQFTLYGDCRKGNRPSFVGSAPPERAEQLYDLFGRLLRREWPQVAEGRFGARMEVALVNDGPVTVILEKEAAAPGGSAGRRQGEP
jgi:D-tyrosyl-tRNA(Tyr) deacylase